MSHHAIIERYITDCHSPFIRQPYNAMAIPHNLENQPNINFGRRMKFLKILIGQTFVFYKIAEKSEVCLYAVFPYYPFELLISFILMRDKIFMFAGIGITTLLSDNGI